MEKIGNTLYPVEADINKLDIKTTATLKVAVLEKKRIEEDYKDFTKKLLTSMEENNVWSYKDDNLTITYVSPSDSIGVNLEKLKEKFPEAYEECIKVTHKSASIRITPSKEKKE